MKLKPFFAIATVSGLISSAPATVIFSGGTGGTPVSITFTEDMTFPVTVIASTVFVAVVFEDVYSTDSLTNPTLPVTVYGTPGAIGATWIPGVGPTVAATAYNSFGDVNGTYGLIDPDDFYALFRFGSTGISTNSGDSIVISAGTVVLAPEVRLPDRPITTIAIATGTGVPLAPIPEPGLALLGAGGLLGFLRRRRPTC